MKDKIKKGIDFTKKNPTILYSLFLIIAVTAVIFWSAYYSLSKFQKNTDELLQSKAVVADDIFGIMAVNYIEDKELIQKSIDKIKEKDSEIKDISVFLPEEDGENFSLFASSSDIKELEINNDLLRITFGSDNGMAILGGDLEGRYWDVAKIIRGEDGRRIGIVSMQMSLSDHDNFVKNTIRQVYVVSLVSLIIVLFLVGNHARLFKYALRVTKLEEVDQMKDDFISMASHELRAPLTAIGGYIDLLKGNSEKKELTKQELADNKHYLKNIGVSVFRLDDLVNDVLEVSRIEQNRLPVKNENIDISDVINKSVDQMKVSADQKKLKIKDESKKPLNVYADSEKVKQILVNLLSNAIKYTPSGHINVKTKEDSKFIYITIADTGLGIPADNLENLFSKFYRVQTNETKKILGTGLGLWISKELAKKMKGDLYAESIEGVGSHFTLKLKKAKI